MFRFSGVREEHADDYASDYLTDVIGRKAMDYLDTYTAGAMQVTQLPFCITVQGIKLSLNRTLS